MIMLSIIAVLIITVVVAAGFYSRFGGFGTGDCADTEEFLKYAASVSELTVPDEAQIVALGEATHGNKEFQQLRLKVFQVLVEKYGVRAFALERLRRLRGDQSLYLRQGRHGRRGSFRHRLCHLAHRRNGEFGGVDAQLQCVRYAR